MSSEKNPSNGRVWPAALLSLVLGCTGGVTITPLVSSSDLVRKDDLRDALAPVVAQLADIQRDVASLKAEAAVSRYERDHRFSDNRKGTEP